jgi:putative transposase
MAYRCRAYPDKTQQQMLVRTFGCVRVVWNRTLAARNDRWQIERKGTSYAQTDAALTAMKKDVQLAKTTAPLQFVWSWPDIDLTALDPTTVIVCREPNGRWYVTFTIETNALAPLEEAGHAVGVDLGVTEFAVTSDGETIANPRCLERKARNLARYQRRMARCREGSANRAKAAAKVARAHRKVRCARRDFLHRASTRLVRSADTIVIEDLHVVGMVHNRHLARVISDCGWGEFRHQLEYKCQRYGRRLVVIDRWYPSSKTCSACGHVLAELSLSTRHWTCPSCRARHDRDLNAAKNILAAGLAVTACGAGVRHRGSSSVQPAVKQERRPVTAGIPALLRSGEPSTSLGSR